MRVGLAERRWSKIEFGTGAKTMAYLTPYFKVGHNWVILSHGALTYILCTHNHTKSLGCGCEIGGELSTVAYWSSHFSEDRLTDAPMSRNVPPLPPLCSQLSVR